MIHITHIHTTVQQPFLQDYPDEPVPEETFTRPNPSWSSDILYHLPPATTIHSNLLVLDSPFPQPLSRSSLVWDPLLHTPCISSPNRHLLVIIIIKWSTLAKALTMSRSLYITWQFIDKQTDISFSGVRPWINTMIYDDTHLPTMNTQHSQSSDSIRELMHTAHAAFGNDAPFRFALYITFTLHYICLQCSDTVGWAAGRASGL